MRVYKPRYKDRKGNPRETSKWYIEFRDHDDRLRRIAALNDQKASEFLAYRIDRLVAMRIAGQGLDADMSRWLEDLPRRILKRLAEWRIIDPNRVAATRNLRLHLKDF